MSVAYQYRTNASSPSFVSVFATSGSTGTGTFWAGPDASAGLYTAVGVGVGVDGGLDVAEPVGVEGTAPGSAGAPPAQPASMSAAATAAPAAADRIPQGVETLIDVMGR
ncbi:hypothetical protein J2X12_001825 [Pseudarthrobacter oxydans]|uniref:Uncharacterized protein n=1 Tax=Pseudarthrobacter oxydans TaxID=1671 RepID=A0AAW8NBW9_PSEOX|nr:hypothetical protein [Pseudarthrobacter oxydans]MDR6792924.1 hypothetical protein [Pseudarthrobacter oxydans]MDR7163810.1 hypothetical protein [Pseudarthrobacter oxydans]